jgi:hypothetical protein
MTKRARLKAELCSLNDRAEKANRIALAELRSFSALCESDGAQAVRVVLKVTR